MINRKWALTIYPPRGAALLPTAGLAVSGPIGGDESRDPSGGCGFYCSATTLAQAARLPRYRILLYAWHPLVIVELGISGHLDGLMLPFVLLAFLRMLHSRFWLVGVSLAIATLIKLYPAIILPALYRKGGWSMPLVFFGIVGMGYLLYLDAGAEIIGYLPSYSPLMNSIILVYDLS